MQRTTRLNNPARPARGYRLLLATAVVALAGGLSQAALAAPPDGAGPGGMRGMHGMHGMHDGAGMMGLGGGRHLDRMLDAVKATPEQRAQIQQIMKTAQADSQARREAGRTLHQQGQALFAQPTVDARAAETLRQQMVAQHDEASKRKMQVMLDVSRVLTPEQRKTLADRIAQRRSMMERHQQERQQVERTPR